MRHVLRLAGATGIPLDRQPHVPGLADGLRHAPESGPAEISQRSPFPALCTEPAHDGTYRSALHCTAQRWCMHAQPPCACRCPMCCDGMGWLSAVSAARRGVKVTARTRHQKRGSRTLQIRGGTGGGALCHPAVRPGTLSGTTGRFAAVVLISSGAPPPPSRVHA